MLCSNGFCEFDSHTTTNIKYKIMKNINKGMRYLVVMLFWLTVITIIEFIVQL